MASFNTGVIWSAEDDAANLHDDAPLEDPEDAGIAHTTEYEVRWANTDFGSSAEGVWNIQEALIGRINPRGRQVTVTEMRINAAEAWVHSWSPNLARFVRRTFDRLERIALRGRTEPMWTDRWLLWESGRFIFPVMGWAAVMLLTVFGKSGTVAQQYVPITQ